MTQLLQLAWRNLLRNPRRTLLTASGTALSVAALMMVLGLLGGLNAQMREVLVTRSLGHVQLRPAAREGGPRLSDTLDGVDAVLRETDALPGVAGAAPRLIGNVLLGDAEHAGGVELRGVDPVREDAIGGLSSQVIAGRWLSRERGGELVLGVDVARRLETGIGEQLLAVTQAADGSIGNDLFRVVGVVRTGSALVDGGAGFLHLDDLGELLVLPDRAHTILVVGEDPSDRAIRALLPELRTVVGDGARVDPWWEVDPATAAALASQDAPVYVLVLFFYGVSALGVVNTLLVSVMERTRELGVMRAVGLRAGAVVRLVVLESFLLSVLAAALGGLLGGLGTGYLGVVGFDLTAGDGGYQTGTLTFDPVIHARITPSGVWLPILGAMASSLVASFWPALRAARIHPADAMREV